MVAHRYANALLELAENQNVVEDIYKNAQDLSALLKSNRELLNLFKSPLISSDKKEKIITKIFADKINPLFFEFIKLLCKKRRENILYEILHQLIIEYKKRNGIISAQLITAFKFDEELKKSILNKIIQFEHASKIELHEIIDEKIIGGFILKTDNEQIDASVQSQLNKLYQKFIQNNSLN